MNHSYADKTLSIKFLLGLAMLLFLTIFLQGQTVESNTDSLKFQQDIFSSDEALQWSLTFNIRKFRNEKADEEKLPAILSIHEIGDSAVSKDISIKARGESRKKSATSHP